MPRPSLRTPPKTVERLLYGDSGDGLRKNNTALSGALMVQPTSQIRGLTFIGQPTP